MRKHAKDEQIPKRRLWPAATTVVVVAVAAASVIALAGGPGRSVLASDTAHDTAVKLAVVPAVTSKTFYGCERSTGNRKVFDLSLTKPRCPSGSHRVSGAAGSGTAVTRPRRRPPRRPPLRRVRRPPRPARLRRPRPHRPAPIQPRPPRRRPAPARPALPKATAARTPIRRSRATRARSPSGRTCGARSAAGSRP